MRLVPTQRLLAVFPVDYYSPVMPYPGSGFISMLVAPPREEAEKNALREMVPLNLGFIPFDGRTAINALFPIQVERKNGKKGKVIGTSRRVEVWTKSFRTKAKRLILAAARKRNKIWADLIFRIRTFRVSSSGPVNPTQPARLSVMKTFAKSSPINLLNKAKEELNTSNTDSSSVIRKASVVESEKNPDSTDYSTSFFGKGMKKWKECYEEVFGEPWSGATRGVRP